MILNIFWSNLSEFIQCEPGVVPATLDRYKLERFAFNDVIQVEIIEVDDHDPSKLNRVTLMSGGRGRGRCRGTTTNTYVPPSTRNESTLIIVQIKSPHQPTYFFIRLEDDFPTLYFLKKYFII